MDHSASQDSGIVRVLGVGNVLMGDDAFGPWVVRVLESRYEIPEAVEVIDAGTPGLDFLPFISHARSVIVIDTVHSEGPPGTLRIYRDDELLATPPPARMSPHQPGIREALMATELTDSSPGEMVIIGVVPETVETRTRLSEALHAAIEPVLAATVDELRRLGFDLEERAQPLPLGIWWEDQGDGRGTMNALTATHERCLVVLIALHSFIVGVAFMIAPEWLVRFGGWPGIDPVLFGRQAGIFHVVLATAYLIEYFRYRGIWVLISAKCYAVLFLGAMCIVEPATWAMAVSAAGDGAMVVLSLWVHRKVTGSGDQEVNG